MDADKHGSPVAVAVPDTAELGTNRTKSLQCCLAGDRRDYIHAAMASPEIVLLAALRQRRRSFGWEHKFRSPASELESSPQSMSPWVVFVLPAEDGVWFFFERRPGNESHRDARHETADVSHISDAPALTGLKH